MPKAAPPTPPAQTARDKGAAGAVRNRNPERERARVVG